MPIDPTKGEKTHPFSDQEIKPIAEEISKSDENRGNDDENWSVAIEKLKNKHPIKYFWWKTNNHTCIFITKPLYLFYNSQNRDFTLDIIKTLVSFSSLVATFIAAFSLISGYNHNNERLITDRFSKAVEQLGSQKPEVRIGAIYALERISKDSEKDYWTVMEVLTAFIRKQSNLTTESKNKEQNTQKIETKDKEIPELTIDIQAAITVLKRRSKSYGNGEKGHINLYKAKIQQAPLGRANLQRAFLRKTNLQQANLWGANLQKAFLLKANLQQAFLVGANLQKADLRRANLQQADLWGANLQQAFLFKANFQKAFLFKANLQKADLQKAFLFKANLQQAFLGRANLQQAFLGGANLQKANLIRVKNLTHQQIKSACFWKQAIYKVEDKENKQFIEQLKQDKKSDPKQPIDCSFWKFK